MPIRAVTRWEHVPSYRIQVNRPSGVIFVRRASTVNSDAIKVGTNSHSCRERGYVLLIILLFVALLSIGSLATFERISVEIKRDREEELIHRGVQYSRAVR